LAPMTRASATHMSASRAASGGDVRGTATPHTDD
jgi:hypothetical protein